MKDLCTTLCKIPCRSRWSASAGSASVSAPMPSTCTWCSLPRWACGRGRGRQPIVSLERGDIASSFIEICLLVWVVRHLSESKKVTPTITLKISSFVHSWKSLCLLTGPYRIQILDLYRLVITCHLRWLMRNNEPRPSEAARISAPVTCPLEDNPPKSGFWWRRCCQLREELVEARGNLAAIAVLVWSAVADLDLKRG